MRSSYRTTDAAQFLETHAGDWGADLASRVHTSRLLGADPSLVLHGGGNTSVKSTSLEHTGEDVEVLWVKGSGWDLGTIDARGFSACRLEPLLRLCSLPQLSDEGMVAALRSQMLDPAGPTPSVEALLHAFLPGKFVDHTHADAVLAIQDQPNARAIAEEVWGPSFRFIPYVMPGFALAKRVVDLAGDLAGVHGLILEQHGIFTWGETAEESYERMIAGVTAAEEWRASRRAIAAVKAVPIDPALRNQRQAAISSRLRGALARAGQGRFVMEWRTEEAVLALAARTDGEAITARGTVTPDHVLRTKPRPLWLDIPAASSTETIARSVAEGVARYASWYEGYFARGSAAHAGTLSRLDTAPRVVIVPELGALTIGRSRGDARIVGDIVSRSAAVIQSAESVGAFHPVDEQHLFDVEYWSLEQAKLAKPAGGLPLAGRVAFITGAARGIGRATAEHFHRLGAHLFLTDIDERALTETISTIDAAEGVRTGSSIRTRIDGCSCDVTSSESVAGAVERAVLAFGGLDILVSNAGTAPQGLLHSDEGDAALIASIEINLLGHQRVARAVTAVLTAQGIGGCLLFNASKSAVNQGPEFGPYAVPKAGLLALMRQYAVDLGSVGIRANAVNADRIRTDLFGGGVLEARAKARGLAPDEYFRQNLLSRETTASDVAEAFGWLALAEATTGCVISVDGGNAAAFLR